MSPRQLRAKADDKGSLLLDETVWVRRTVSGPHKTLGVAGSTPAGDTTFLNLLAHSMNKSKAAPSPAIYFKGYEFRAPFQCLNCGFDISPEQFAFARLCGSCDTADIQRSPKIFSGPRKLVKPDDPLCISKHLWATKEEIPALKKRIKEMKELAFKMRKYRPKHRMQ